MGKLIKKFKMACLILTVFSMLTCPVIASELTEDDSELMEGASNSFYVPRSRFMSSYDYEIYCERMYNHGYMDENYEWTPEAKTYINNMTTENYEALDQAARVLVEERIENGTMKRSDSAYLTYEERQEALKEEREATANPTEEAVTLQPDNPSTSQENPDITSGVEMEPVVTEVPELTEEPDTGSPARIVIFAILAAAVALGAYHIYRRQF